MSPSNLLERLLNAPPYPQISYADVVPVLRAVGYEFLYPEGALRYWQHWAVRRILMLRDEGVRPMYPGYIRAASRDLIRVRNAGGLPQ